MSIGIQDAKEQGYEWVCAEHERLLADPNRDFDYYKVIQIAKEQMEQESDRAADQAQKIAEVDNMALPFDFDTDFSAEGLNVIVRQMLKEERAKNYADFDAEYDRLLTECSEKLKGVEERELQLIHQNEYLNTEVERLAGTAQSESMRADELQEFIDMQKATIAEKDKEIHDLKNRMNEIEQNRKNAAAQLEEAQAEILRLEDQIDEMRRANVFGERKAQQIIDVTPTTNELYEQAKKATAAKRQVKIIGSIGANFKEVEDAEGNTDVIHVSAIGSEVEAVDSFPELPALEIPAQPEPIGAPEDVAQSHVVLGGSEDTGCGDQDETAEHSATENIPYIEEVAQETAHSEEVGETSEYTPIGMRLHETHEEWVTRTLNELQIAVYGQRVREAA